MNYLSYTRVAMEQISIVKEKETFCFELCGKCRSLKREREREEIRERDREAKAVEVFRERNSSV